jgi:hypothetical protein
MLLTALGSQGPGSRLTVINTVQWAGDYLVAGVTDVELDLRNISMVELHVRLLFADPAIGPPENVAITEAVILQAGSDWTHAIYSIDPGDLIALQGDPNLALSQATEMRIFHNVAPEYPPQPVVAQLGVDNIRAAGGATPVRPSSWGALRGLYR